MTRLQLRGHKERDSSGAHMRGFRRGKERSCRLIARPVLPIGKRHKYLYRMHILDTHRGLRT
jgi:hypothetical protein